MLTKNRALVTKVYQIETNVHVYLNELN